MQVQVSFDPPRRDVARLGDFAVRRTRFALRRLIALNPRAQVELSDASDPTGTAVARCHVRVETDGGGTVVATALAVDWRVAIEAALARAVRRLLRLWRRASQHRALPRLPRQPS